MRALSMESQAAATRIANMSTTNNNHTPAVDWRKRLKACTKAVRKASKAVQGALTKQTKNNEITNNDDGKKSNSVLTQALQELGTAAQALETCRQGLQRWQDDCPVVLDASRTVGVVDVALLQDDGVTRKKPYLTISVQHLHRN